MDLTISHGVNNVQDLILIHAIGINYRRIGIFEILQGRPKTQLIRLKNYMRSQIKCARKQIGFYSANSSDFCFVTSKQLLVKRQIITNLLLKTSGFISIHKAFIYCFVFACNVNYIYWQLVKLT